MRARLKILIGVIQLALFVGIVFLFAGLKLDDYFDNVTVNLFSKGHIVIISFRFLIYLFPAFLVWIVFLFIKKHKLTLKDSFRYQFIVYSIVGLAWVLSGLDYITSTDVFGAMDSFAIMIGLLLSLVLKKDVKIDSSIPPVYKNQSTKGTA